MALSCICPVSSSLFAFLKMVLWFYFSENGPYTSKPWTFSKREESDTKCIEKGVEQIENQINEGYKWEKNVQKRGEHKNKDAGSEKELGENQESSTEISGYENNEIWKK